MHLRKGSISLRRFAFRLLRASVGVFPGGKISAFGTGDDRISSILVINLDRQPLRWRRVLREIRRFRTSNGESLASIAQRFVAVDARDGRAVAATADVDSTYRIANQLYVQPDARLEECFSVDERIRMTRQEIAIARSHIEVWKTVATGPHKFVLVLEDDVWFERGAATTIDRGWRAALQRCRSEGGPHLLYLSYEDAGGTAERADVCNLLFRPIRGLWFLSGYVLSREGAATLLRAMPVVGPVDTWMNYRFEELGALALSSPVILQSEDIPSANSYSILPYLARAGIVDANSNVAPTVQMSGEWVFAWTSCGEQEGLAMALSVLGLRVRMFDGDEQPIQAKEIPNLFEEFDALVDAPLTPDALSVALTRTDSRFLVETTAELRFQIEFERLPLSRTVILPHNRAGTKSWGPLCDLLGLDIPVQPFPVGAPRRLRIFRDDRPNATRRSATEPLNNGDLLDDSPWVLPPQSGWQSRPPTRRQVHDAGECLVHAAMTTTTSSFSGLVETFPGNLASFAKEGLRYNDDGAHLTVSVASNGNKPYRSGAFASTAFFEHGRFEVELRAASGSGLITGFFLHRDTPRQEIDIEIAGNDPRSMLANVYFNPGDDGTTMDFGYRGSPCRIDLGFDATSDFHLYAIDWRPGRISWLVDDKIVHERVGWDPTPLPHLPMRLHANLWVPRSKELAGQLDNDTLPSTATFRKILVRA